MKGNAETGLNPVQHQIPLGGQLWRSKDTIPNFLKIREIVTHVKDSLDILYCVRVKPITGFEAMGDSTHGDAPGELRFALLVDQIMHSSQLGGGIFSISNVGEQPSCIFHRGFFKQLLY
jgi:hypothetical protein